MYTNKCNYYYLLSQNMPVKYMQVQESTITGGAKSEYDDAS